MCTQSDQVIVQHVLADFLASRKSFTAFDVSQEARKRGADERHLHLKSATHGAWRWMTNQDYTREAIPIPGHSQTAWLYYHEDTLNPVNNYLADLAYASQPQFTPPAAATDDGDADWDLVQATAQGRLQISPKRLKEIGLTKGNLAYITKNGVDNQIAIQNSPQDTVLKTVMINDDGRLRIGQKYLAKIADKLDCSKVDFTVRQDNGKVLISYP